MRYALWMILLLSCVPAAVADIVISQAYPDPIETESGGEFVMLHNTGNSQDISGWVISTSSSAQDATLPEGTVLNTGQYYLLSDVGWNASKDDADWPEADHEETITLKNSNSGVALVDMKGVVQDAVGWGDTELKEGTATTPAATGESLQRVNETGDNSKDFITGTPVFPNSGGGLHVEVTVQEPQVVIHDTQVLLDDAPDPGIQLLPEPGALRDVPVSLTLEGGKNVSVHAALGTKRQELNFTGGKYTGSVGLAHYLVPGMHNITFTAEDGSHIAVAKQSVEVAPLLALGVDASTLAFGTMLPGEYKEITGDRDTTTPAPTLENLGNTPVHLTYLSSDLTAGAFHLNASALELRVDQITRTLTTQSQTLATPIEVQTKKPLAFALTIPESAIGGTYEGTITLRGAPIE